MKANEKKCPRCAEVIKKDARVCKHCGYEYSEAQIAADKAQEAKNQQNGAIGCVVLIVVILLISMFSSSNEKPTPANDTEQVAAISPAEAKALEERNKDQIAARLKEARALPASDISGNARAYEELVKLAPANTEFSAKRDKYKAALSKVARFEGHPEEALELTKISWEKGGFGNIQLLRFTVKNSAPFAIKDFTLECIHQGPSGTDMDSNTRVVYDMVPANGSKRIREVNMGFINSQVTTSRCSITNAKKV
ncbi:zinc ribbon domain-containing protein [Sphingobium sp. B11D3A]|uniref:zinc ribbon domain-containing protein n=1 Tax=Sphingobium sp. B11D3A TaxID=2940574 RepID=UPI0022247FAD|nr:zinc ribbon domain-containing protein [Sphingobium sp. B11D3A]MCW2392268.1 hypothetical protein [Sphingobium sp. B11D3A]